MKKRSLVAAIAMLVVSAIVLTSSTYAWFASNSSASVSNISATVTNNDGSLQVMATDSAAAGAVWKTAIVATDYTGLPSALHPVSMNINSGSPTFYKVTYDGQNFTAGSAGASNTDYLVYGFDVKYTNGGDSAATINVTPTWGDTSNFCYALIQLTAGGTTTNYILASAGSYTAVTNVTGTIDDSTGATAAVIDATDDGYANATMGAALGGATTTTSGTALTFSAAASTATTANVKVYIWAEGQDANCTGTVNSESAQISFGIGVA